MGFVYRHPSMDLTNFNCNYLNKLLENISKEQKSIFLLGDFNVNLLNYNEHNQTNKFLDSPASNSFIPFILQKSISLKNKLFTNFINKKDSVLKEEFHTIYKKYRNLLYTLRKKSKQDYYDKCFERNWNNIKNTWKGIKSPISLKTVASNVPTVLSLDNGDTITNPYDIANTFNNYFASIAETTKISIK